MDEHDPKSGPVRPLIFAPSPRGKRTRFSPLPDLSAYEGLIELHDPKAASPVVILRAMGRRFDA